MHELTYTSVCRNNGVIIFDALAKTELQTGRRLHEDLLDFSNQIERRGYCTYYPVKSKQMMVAALKTVLNECRSGVLYPVLHFECHGDPSKGIYIHASDEYIGWDELVRYINEINVATRNNVGVVLAACFGFEISKFVNFASPCPFNFVIAAQDEILAGQLQEVLIGLYKATMSSGDLEAGLRSLDDRLNFFHCGKWFYQNLASYMINNFNAVGRSDLVEAIVSSRVAKAGYQSRELVRFERARAKKYLKTPQNFYRQASRRFFHDKVPISYEDFNAFVGAKKRK
ncbi:hypothetical protein PMI32_02380 [Pseudomonas sp. GM60]|nr:hypothetical protein PMI32_02380 [Pseudomonas sp. GM60]